MQVIKGELVGRVWTTVQFWIRVWTQAQRSPAAAPAGRPAPVPTAKTERAAVTPARKSSTSATSPAVGKCTGRLLICGHTYAGTRARGLSSAAGRSVGSASLARMSCRDTREHTQVKRSSHAQSVPNASCAAIISPSM